MASGGAECTRAGLNGWDERGDMFRSRIIPVLPPFSMGFSQKIKYRNFRTTVDFLLKESVLHPQLFMR